MARWCRAPGGPRSLPAAPGTQLIWTAQHPAQPRPSRGQRIPNVKHVTYYLLVPISFPDIHTRQVCHDEGPQLLMVGELQGSWASGRLGVPSQVNLMPARCSPRLLPPPWVCAARWKCGGPGWGHRGKCGGQGTQLWTGHARGKPQGPGQGHWEPPSLASAHSRSSQGQGRVSVAGVQHPALAPRFLPSTPGGKQSQTPSREGTGAEVGNHSMSARSGQSWGWAWPGSHCALWCQARCQQP